MGLFSELLGIMDLTRVDDLRTALKLAGIHPRKGLGQHFLIDRKSLELIIDSASPDGNDTVLEIGPGLGVMTQPLTQRVGKLVAVEADVVLAELLRRDAPSNRAVLSRQVVGVILHQYQSLFAHYSHHVNTDQWDFYGFRMENRVKRDYLPIILKL